MLLPKLNLRIQAIHLELIYWWEGCFWRLRLHRRFVMCLDSAQAAKIAPAYFTGIKLFSWPLMPRIGSTTTLPPISRETPHNFSFRTQFLHPTYCLNGGTLHSDATDPFINFAALLRDPCSLETMKSSSAVGSPNPSFFTL